MPLPKTLSLALAAGALLIGLPAQAVTINSFNLFNVDVDFLPGGTIDFDADFLFDDFDIASQTGGAGDLGGLGGEIDGTFTFDTLGAVTSAGGTFSIDDGDGDSSGSDDLLTGTLNFDSIGFSNFAVSQVVSINGTTTFDPGYSGANTDLATLSSSGIEYQISTDFFFFGLTTFENLFTNGDAGGTLLASVGQVTVPEPGALAILGLGLVGIGVFSRRRGMI